MFESSGLLDVEHCAELDDAALLYDEMVRHEYEHDAGSFNVQVCLAQKEWDRDNRPKRSLFVLTAHKRQNADHEVVGTR